MKIRLFICVFVCLQLNTSAQIDSISGIINTYVKVLDLNIGLNSIRIFNAGLFSVGDLIMLHQSKGANLNTSSGNSGLFGDVIQYNAVGLYEINRICKKKGDTLFLENKLLTYDHLELLQCIRIPEYKHALVTDTLKSLSWDGEKGGILVLKANRITLDAPIDVSKQGFRGGTTAILPFACSWLINNNAVSYDSASLRGANKGEGIALADGQHARGRGKWGNAGGGGNDHNSGGGGGSNAGIGGAGGQNNEPGALNCKGYNPGIGGQALNASFQRLYFGGGGGAGHANNTNRSAGANAGGIILIMADTLDGNILQLNSNGANAVESYGDGAGGGGAGGTIAVECKVLLDTLLVSNKGGNGGNANGASGNRCFGPGGGGGGGFSYFSFQSAPSLLKAENNGGNPGTILNSTNSCNGTSSGAASGANGSVLFGFAVTKQKEFRSVLLPADTSICQGASLSLSVNSGFDTYLWNTGDTQRQAFFDSTQNIWIQAEFGVCQVRDSMKLNVIPFQQVQLGNDTVLCDGQSILLETNVQGYPLLWNTGDTSEKLLANKSGLYVLQAGTFCKTFDSILIQYIPNTLRLPKDTFFCLGDSIRLEAGLFVNYLWNTGSTDSFIYAKTPGIFFVETNTAHCFYNDSILVSSETQFKTGLPTDTFMCNNGLVLLQAKAGVNAYLWNTGDTTTQLNVSQAGLYWLRTGKSCFAFDSITITNEMVQLTLPNDTSVCEGSNVWIKPITKRGAQNQFWNTNETSDSINISNSGWYILKISGLNCTASDSVNVTLKPIPIFDLGTDTFICRGETIALEVSTPADSYQWSNGSNTAKILVTSPGNYRAIALKDICFYSDSVQVSLKNLPFLNFPDTNLCNNDSILISVDPSLFRYRWNTGELSSQISVKQAGNYAVTYSDTFCSNTLTIQVDECPQQELYIPNAFSPNSDGLNDKFTISLPPNCLGKLTIYNRWGAELLHVEGNNLAWDGTFNGSLCQGDVYFYVLNVTICKTKSYNGKIGLIR